MILVVGATGSLGSDICLRLVTQGRSVCGLVRHTADPMKLEHLQTLGVVLAYGDLKQPASLAAACQGVNTVITTATTALSQQPGDSIEATDLAGQLNLVAAAQAARVRHFVYFSYARNIDSNDPCSLTIAKRTVEQQVQGSGMSYTILRPSFSMDIWLSPLLGFDYPSAKATIYGAGHNKISWIARKDVTEFAVQSLNHPAARNAVLELGGPQALSPLEVVTIFEELSGRPFTLTHIPVEMLQFQRTTATDVLQKSLTALLLSYAAGSSIAMDEIRSVFSISLTSVRDYARRVLTTE